MYRNEKMWLQVWKTIKIWTIKPYVKWIFWLVKNHYWDTRVKVEPFYYWAGPGRFYKYQIIPANLICRRIVHSVTKQRNMLQTQERDYIQTQSVLDGFPPPKISISVHIFRTDWSVLSSNHRVLLAECIKANLYLSVYIGSVPWAKLHVTI